MFFLITSEQEVPFRSNKSHVASREDYEKWHLNTSKLIYLQDDEKHNVLDFEVQAQSYSQARNDSYPWQILT